MLSRGKEVERGSTRTQGGTGGLGGGVCNGIFSSSLRLIGVSVYSTFGISHVPGIKFFFSFFTINHDTSVLQ